MYGICVALLLIFQTAHANDHDDDYEYDFGDKYSFNELKTYLNTFESTLTSKLQSNLAAFEARVSKRLDIEVQRLRRLARRTSTQVPILVKEKVTDLVKDGTMKSFIDNTLLHQVNHLQKGLRLMKVKVRSNTAQLSKIKAKDETIEYEIFASTKEQKRCRNETQVSHDITSALQEVTRHVNRSLDITETRMKDIMKAEVAHISSRIQQISNDLKVLDHDVKAKMAENRSANAICKCDKSGVDATNKSTAEERQRGGPCAEGWVSMHRACYKFDQRKMTWDHAKQACREEGGNLISISSNAEKKKITRELRKYVTQPDLQTWWVGLRWRSERRKLDWEDGGLFSRRITRWGPGEPNNGRGRKVEHCVELKYNEFLSDEHCMAARPFICERHEIVARPIFQQRL